MTETTSKSGTHQVDKVKLIKSLSRVIGFGIVAALLITVTNMRIDRLSAEHQAQSNWQPEKLSVAEKFKQLDCLTRNIYYEAGNEPFEGKVAVAQVTMNRVASGQFAGSVCDVVYQRNVFVKKVVCQFSWFCESTHKTKPIYSAQWAASEEAAKKVMFENFRLSGLNDALYYHADYVSPGWRNMEKVGKIGRHIFYKPVPKSKEKWI